MCGAPVRSNMLNMPKSGPVYVCVYVCDCMCVCAAREQGEKEKELEAVKEEVTRRDTDIKQLQRSLKEAENVLVCPPFFSPSSLSLSSS